MCLVRFVCRMRNLRQRLHVLLLARRISLSYLDLHVVILPKHVDLLDGMPLSQVCGTRNVVGIGDVCYHISPCDS